MSSKTATLDTARARKAMIDSQLRTSGVNEEFVLARMMAVPRENFLPQDKAMLAYIDRSVPLDQSGAMASPLFYGKLLLEGGPMPDDTVLVVEGGTGYLTELVRPLVKSVETVSAADAAAGTLPEGATYSLILIDGALEVLPDAIKDALADNGRIVTGVVLRQVTRLAAGRKIAGNTALEPVEDIGIPVLHDFDEPKSWTF